MNEQEALAWSRAVVDQLHIQGTLSSITLERIINAYAAAAQKRDNRTVTVSMNLGKNSGLVIGHVSSI